LGAHDDAHQWIAHVLSPERLAHNLTIGQGRESIGKCAGLKGMRLDRR